MGAANSSVAAQDHAIQQAFGSLPALPAPEGQVSNYNHPANRGWTYVLGSSIIIPVVFLFVLLRTYTKWKINKSGLGKEDFACLVAFVGLLVYNALCLRELKFGSGVHQWNVPSIDGLKFAQGANYLSIAYIPTIFFAKLSLLLSFLKLFAGLQRGVIFWLCHITIGTNLVFYLTMLFLLIFQCWPIAKIWDPLIPGKCVDPMALLIVTAAINSATDLILFALPIGSIFKLKMGVRQKWAISTVFATGLFACCCSVVRFGLSVGLAGKSDFTADLTYVLTAQGLWANGELGSAIVAGCMLSIPQFVRHAAPKILGWGPARSSRAGRHLATWSAATVVADEQWPAQRLDDPEEGKGGEWAEERTVEMVQGQGSRESWKTVEEPIRHSYITAVEEPAYPEKTAERYAHCEIFG